MKHIYLGLLFSFTAFSSYAQPSFRTIDSININNINASVLVHGDMWWNGDSGRYKSHCTFPIDSNTSIGFFNAIWMSGYDDGGALHVAGQTYRQDGNDYWPGPLDASGRLSYATSADWAYIWKVKRTDINHFRSLSVHTSGNTPASILYWPGAGNAIARGAAGVSLTVPTGREMAPFVDLNHNGNYEPLLGEYPDVRGDMALWWIFSDNGPSHNQSRGVPLGVEVHALAYAYKRGTLIDNVVYYNYKVVNRSRNNYSRFRLADWNDFDLGYYLDDFIGFDSSRRMGIGYNGAIDGAAMGGGHAYFNTYPPVIGLTFVHLPGDVASTSYVPAGSFTTYNNDFSSIANPRNDITFNNYIRPRQFGTSIVSGRPCRTDTTTLVNYLFPDDPSEASGWSECNCSHAVGDRRYILSSNDNYLAAGQTLDFTLALVTTNCSDSNYCPYVNFRGIREVADTAWAVYEHPLWETGVIEPSFPRTHATLYPNPAQNNVTLELDRPYFGEACIRDLPGRVVRTFSINTLKTTINITDLTPGTYTITTEAKELPAILFTKQ